MKTKNLEQGGESAAGGEGVNMVLLEFLIIILIISSCFVFSIILL